MLPNNHSLIPVLNAMVGAGGSPYIVGGAVRDWIMDRPPKDYDVEVYNITFERLGEILRQFGKVDFVGQSFGVYKLWVGDDTYDFSLPRRERKIGPLHTDYEVHFDPFMNPKEGAERRDFTINAVMYSWIEKRVFDPYYGKEDIEYRILAVVSDRFKEDPLRVLRGMQFMSRFDLDTSIKTCRVSRELRDTYHTIPKERVWVEWEKWAHGAFPSKGLGFLQATDWIINYPELSLLRVTPQRQDFHPEGDVWTHTKYVCDAMANICIRENITGEDRTVLMMAALTHDIAKPETTVFEREQWRSPEHDTLGAVKAEKFLANLGCYPRIIERTVPLIREHMFPTWENPSRKAVRRLMHRLQPATLKELIYVIEADYSGRPPLPKGLPQGAERIISMVDEELPEKIEPILMGRHLIQLGFQPGLEMGIILKEAFEAQLDEEFIDLEGALRWAHAHPRIRSYVGSAGDACSRT